MEKAKLHPENCSAADVLGDLMLAMHYSPKLCNCSDASILNALRICKKVGVRIGAGPTSECWLIAYGQDCQVNIGAKAYVTLALRNGHILSVESTAVYVGDEFSVEPGMYGKVSHRYGPSNPSGDDTRITHVYSQFACPDGSTRRFVLTRQEIEEKHRAKSQAKDDTAWVQHWKEMAFKSVQAYPFHRGWMRYASEEGLVHRGDPAGESIVVSDGHSLIDDALPEVLPPSDIVNDQTPPPMVEESPEPPYDKRYRETGDFDENGMPTARPQTDKDVATADEPPAEGLFPTHQQGE